MTTRNNTLLAIVGCNAVTAISGGVALIFNAAQPPLRWLAHTPFNSYLLPGLLLMIIVGGSALAAFLTSLGQKAGATTLAFLSGLIMFGWIICEILLIRQFSWLQTLYLLSGAVVIVLSYPDLKSPIYNKMN